jgi:hypothetical protein
MAAPVLLVHLYSQKALKQILPVLAQGQRPAGTVFLGSYGINRADAVLIKAQGAGALYAPTFHLAPQENAALRDARPTPVPAAKDLHKQFAGKLPSPATQFSATANKRLPRQDPRGWGLELGRRFRDQLETQRAVLKATHAHLPESQRPTIAGWQLDEIYSECRLQSAEGRAYRQFTGGVIRGIAEGRTEFGHKPEQGFIWLGGHALTPLPALSLANDDVRQFWEDVDAGAKYLVGEEYPLPLHLTPAQAGAHFAQGHIALTSHASPHCKALAKRYIVGMTPGWKRGTVDDAPLDDATPVAKVKAWRRAFITNRTKKQKPAGYGQFSFDAANVKAPERVDEAIAALNFAAIAHAGH